MAIDVFSEKVVSLKEAVRMLPRKGHTNTLHFSTIYRWIMRGLKTKDGLVVRLETIKVGGTLCTSQEALQRFFDRLSGDTAVVAPPSFTKRQRERHLDKVEEELRKLGI